MSMQEISLTKVPQIIGELSRIEGNDPGFNDVERIETINYLRKLGLIGNSKTSPSSDSLSRFVKNLTSQYNDALRLPTTQIVERACEGNPGQYCYFYGSRKETDIYLYSLRITFNQDNELTVFLSTKVVTHHGECIKKSPCM